MTLSFLKSFKQALVVTLGLVGAMTFMGCGVSSAVRDADAAPATALIGTIQGSNFGGHAPITGANLFVLEATTNGYGAVAKSLLTSSSNNASYPTQQDTSGGVTNGMYYVQTDATGSFNVSGDYTCDAGAPLYLYAAGGSPSTVAAATATQATVSSGGSPYTITFTTNTQSLYPGEAVTFMGSGAGFGSYIQRQELTVLAAGLTTTKFAVQVNSLTSNGTTLTAGSTYSGLSSVNASPTNAAIVNLAMLGVCSGTIPSSLSFVFMNEVSTVAAAYAMAGFAKDSLHIGSSSTNVIGLQNAAMNASTLYNIQGGPISTTADGEGHIANLVNPNNSNGVVPQTTIDTLANIVASCVDSTNTAVGTTPAALTAESAACRGLFLAATSNGVTVASTAGVTTVPIDTATAMINLAHYPAGVNTYPNAGVMDSTNPATLFNLPTGTVPFAPQLGNAPKDWTIALTYKNIPTPSAIAIDAKGDAYVGTYSATAGYITELTPQGTVNATSTTSVPNLSALGVSTASAVWAASHSNSQVYKFNSALTTSNSFISAQTQSPTALAIDSSGNVYVVNNSGNYQYYFISEFNSAGAVAYYSGNYEYSVANGIALATNGGVWLSENNSNFNLFPNPNVGAVSVSLVGGGFSNIDALAVDYQGSAWITARSTGNQSLVRSTNAGVTTSYGINTNNNFAIGGINNPVAVAVDGSNVNNSNAFNVWVANSGNNTISEVNSASTTSTLSPSAGYQSGTGLVNAPSAIAVDNSGNVWATNQGNSTVTEIIGSATPVVTPMAVQTPGVAP